MELMGLPCVRARHASCSGQFVVGVGMMQRRYGCLCSCHQAATEERRREYARLLSQRRINPLHPANGVAATPPKETA